MNTLFLSTKELPGMEDMIVDFIRLKIFEHELKKSKELQRFIYTGVAVSKEQIVAGRCC